MILAERPKVSTSAYFFMLQSKVNPRQPPRRQKDLQLLLRRAQLEPNQKAAPEVPKDDEVKWNQDMDCPPQEKQWTAELVALSGTRDIVIVCCITKMDSST